VKHRSTVAPEVEAFLLTGKVHWRKRYGKAICRDETRWKRSTALSMSVFCWLDESPQTTVPCDLLASGMATGGPVVAALQVSRERPMQAREWACYFVGTDSCGASR